MYIYVYVHKYVFMCICTYTHSSMYSCAGGKCAAKSAGRWRRPQLLVWCVDETAVVCVLFLVAFLFLTSRGGVFGMSTFLSLSLCVYVCMYVCVNVCKL